MTTAIDGIGPQLERAAAGTDPRGWLVFEWLSPELQAAEDSTAVADWDRYRKRPRGFTRAATAAEVTLLTHLGHQVPEGLQTTVTYPTRDVRRRRWLELET